MLKIMYCIGNACVIRGKSFPEYFETRELAEQVYAKMSLNARRGMCAFPQEITVVKMEEV